MCSETVLSVCAVAEGLVAGASAPTVRLHYLSINDDQVRPVFRGTDDNFWLRTLDQFHVDMNFICWEIDVSVFVLTPIFPESASSHLALNSLEC
jgi:hypothetical protein